MACLGRGNERFVLSIGGPGEAVGVEEEGRSVACRGQEKERLVLRTKGGASRVQQKRNSGAHFRMHSRTHKNTPLIAHAHHTRTQGWWGGQWLSFGLKALLPEKVA